MCGSAVEAYNWLLTLGSICKEFCPKCSLSECLITVGDVRTKTNWTQKMKSLNVIPPWRPDSVGHAPSGLTCNNGLFLEQWKNKPILLGMWSTPL